MNEIYYTIAEIEFFIEVNRIAVRDISKLTPTSDTLQ
jgi:hypothetical protein